MISWPDLFTDGGVNGRNPSPLGGTWAWCMVEDGRRVREASGYVTPSQAGLPAVTNNLTELLAVILALEACPAGWAGTLYTDSLITTYRAERRLPGRKPAKMVGIPVGLQERLRAAKARLGCYRVVLVAGHPTHEELACGCRRGVPGRERIPVSKHNCWCDGECARQAAAFRVPRKSVLAETPA